MQKKNLVLQSFLNALLAVVYISLVALLMSNGEALFGQGDDMTMVGPMMILLILVLSASIMGSLFFAKPVMLYLDGKKKEAVRMLSFTIGWTFIFTVLALVINIVL
ncbi:hypothetical protein HYV44_01180 [Candidatus Microgenomates bacterium]|nr:hypothetical protein [Candidatus Microgenomates bacterium]